MAHTEFSFIVSWGMAGLLHNIRASAGTSRGSCDAQQKDTRNAMHHGIN
jgi:hypothetical protein